MSMWHKIFQFIELKGLKLKLFSEKVQENKHLCNNSENWFAIHQKLNIFQYLQISIVISYPFYCSCISTALISQETICPKTRFWHASGPTLLSGTIHCVVSDIRNEQCTYNELFLCWLNFFQKHFTKNFINISHSFYKIWQMQIIIIMVVTTNVALECPRHSVQCNVPISSCLLFVHSSTISSGITPSTTLDLCSRNSRARIKTRVTTWSISSQ